MSDDISVKAIVLGETIRILVHGLDRIGGINYDDTLLMQGPGPIGLSGVAMAEDLETDEIFVTGAPEN